MIEYRRIFLNKDETEKLRNGHCVNREIRGDCVGSVYQIKIIPKKMNLNPRPLIGKVMTKKDWRVIK